MKLGTCALGLGIALASAGPAPGATDPHWGYEHGTEGWSELDPAFATCGDGLRQSPIDVIPATATRTPLPAMTFRYGSSVDLNLRHNGHTVVAEPLAANNTVTIGGKAYTLQQFHMHTPSENFLNGESYPLEYHFVHGAADGSRAVVAVLFDDGLFANAQLDQLIAAMPAPAAPRTLAQFNLRAFVPTGRTFRFPGSLTTPPCDEGVAWHVMATVRTASTTQLAAYASLFSGTEFPGGNRRPLQSRNARPVLTEP